MADEQQTVSGASSEAASDAPAEPVAEAAAPANTAEGTTPRAFRIAGLLITLGMLVEAATLFWARPVSFLVFAGGGAGLVLAGIAVYLWSLLRFAQTAEPG